jgi:hypothetical protein
VHVIIDHEQDDAGSAQILGWCVTLGEGEPSATVAMARRLSKH